MEFLALNRDMGADFRRCPLAIARFKRRDNGQMFAHGLLQPAAQSQLDPPKGLQSALQAQAFLLKEPVPRLPIQDAMEPLVFAVIAICIPRLDGRIASLVGGMQIVQRPIGDPMRGQSGTNGFELGHDLEHFNQFHRAGLAHEYPPARQMLDKAGNGKSLQRFTNWRARDRETLRKLDLVQPITITKSAVKDQPLQRIGNDIGTFLLHPDRSNTAAVRTQERLHCIQDV